MKTATKKKSAKLPNTLYGLLRVAIRDLLKVEKMKKKYVIEMGDWHTPNGKCAVCMAGAVMAANKMIPDAKYIGFPGCYFDDATARKFDAINFLRIGCVHDAAIELEIKDCTVPDRDTHNYSERTEFFKDMRQLLKELKAAKV